MDLSISYIYGEALRLAKKHLGALLLFFLIMALLGVASSVLALPSNFWRDYIDGLQGNTHALERMNSAQSFNPLMLLQYAVSAILTTALYNGLISICRGTGRLGLDSFSLPVSTYAKFLGWYVLYIIIVFVGCICLVFPGLYLAIRLWQGGFYLVENKEASITDALKWSWKATDGHLLDLFGLLMIGIIVMVAVGIGVGILMAFLAAFGGIAGGIVGIVIFLLFVWCWQAVFYMANAMIYTTLSQLAYE